MVSGSAFDTPIGKFQHLRDPFPPEAVGKIPKGGAMLDYVGHAAVTDRLLQVDPTWTWEPPTTDELQRLPTGDGMWIKLTVCGVTRFGWGDGKNIKEWISDAIRNAAMRFGVALDLWSKEDLRSHDENAEGAKSQGKSEGVGTTAPVAASSAGSAGDALPSPPAPGASPAVSKARRDKLKARCVALTADGVSVADAREELKLPLVDSCNEEQMTRFEGMVDDLERELTKPFEAVTS